MKYGILTFHRAANYGAVLQAYALRQSLLSMGHEAEFLDYRCIPVERVHSPLYFRYCSGLRERLKQFLRSPVKWKKRVVFNRFLYRALDVDGAERLDKDALEALPAGKYDVLLTGSDQIWNPYLTCGDTTYLLDFAPEGTIRASYAASFGVSRIPEERIPVYQELLKQYDRITVREESGLACLREMGLTGRTALDPTLLFSRWDWNAFWKEPSIGPYILIYTIHTIPVLEWKARELCRKLRLPLVSLNDTMIRRPGTRYDGYCTPEEWVGWMANAACIVTNSFHSAAFAVNFNRSAWIYVSGAAATINSRILNLLAALDIPSVPEEGIIEVNPSDWNPVNEKLAELRQESRRFLEF